MVTLNQIRLELTDFAKSHGQIVTAKFSRQAELLDGADIAYPAFYYDVDTKPMRKQGRELFMPFRGWVIDRINPEKDNEAEVWNDTSLIALDILAFLDDENRYTFRLQEGTPLTPFTSEGGDIHAGVYFDFTLSIPLALNACIIPVKPGLTIEWSRQIRTLKQAWTEIADFASAHGQIFTSGFGKQSDLITGTDARYTAFYFDINNVSRRAGMLVVSFTAWIADRVNPERDNNADVWNDAIQIATDTLAFLDSTDRNYELVDGATITPFAYAGRDVASGVSLDFTLNIRYAYNRCITPLKPTGYLLTEEGTGYLTTEEEEKIIIETP